MFTLWTVIGCFHTIYQLMNLPSITHSRSYTLAMKRMLSCGISITHTNAGKVTQQVLEAVGVVTCSHLYKHRVVLSQLFSQKSYAYFLHVSLGVQEERQRAAFSTAQSGRKSISTERTFREISKPELLKAKCRELCAALASELAAKGISGRTVTLKIKTIDFEIKSRAASHVRPISSEEDLAATTIALLEKELEQGPLRLRLMGVRLSAFGNRDLGKAQKSITSFYAKGGGVGGSTTINNTGASTSSSTAHGTRRSAVSPHSAKASVNDRVDGAVGRGRATGQEQATQQQQKATREQEQPSRRKISRNHSHSLPLKALQRRHNLSRSRRSRSRCSVWRSTKRPGWKAWTKQRQIS